MSTKNFFFKKTLGDIIGQLHTQEFKTTEE